jgi:tetratricopeptide (TPR) repeat protein
MSKVFISYSHDSEEHAERVLALANRLRNDGVDCVIDQYEPYPPEGWPKWMAKQLRECRQVLILCTETYLIRVNDEEEPGTGKGVKWEATLTYNYIYDDDSKNTRFIPVVFSAEQKAFIPDILRGVSYHVLNDEKGYEQLYRRLTGQPLVIKPGIGERKTLPPTDSPTLFGAGKESAQKISISRLPTTLTKKLFGREKELAMLDEAWQDEHTHMAALIAWGGVGKTCLVNHWLNLMSRDRFKGAEMVYGWSFYSQGASEGKQASADLFIHDTLHWFGDPDPTQGSPTDRGRRLAGLVKAQRTLLILDGMEPLQYPPKQGHGLDGRIKDPGLKALVKELAIDQKGLCVITSREPLSDLEDRAGETGTVKETGLERLDPRAGKELLEKLGATGPPKEMAKAVEEHDGHALALTLLGRYIATFHHGDIRKRDKVKALTGAPKQGAHARRVMAAYENWLEEGPQLDILRLMGLFDRPVEKEALEALTAAPAIPGVTDGLNGAGPDDQVWRGAVNNLRELHLLAAENPERPGGLDCHPLVREHFAERLQTGNPTGWKAAHQRLYKFSKLRGKEQPDTLEEMEPLFAAVAHGCHAGLHQQAMDEVYWPRILRKNEHFTIHKLGAIGADLAALSHFFQTPWRQPAEGLSDAAKSAVLGWAAFRLRALGRVQEAIQGFQVELEMWVKQEDWQNAALAAGNLSQLMLTLGRVPEALDYGQQAVDHADHSGDDFQKQVQHTAFADALHRAGRRDEAAQRFREAEDLQIKEQPELRYLYSAQGYRYCDLLLGMGGEDKVREVMERAEQTLEWAKQQLGLLSNALDHLTLGRAWLMAAQDHPGTTGKVWDTARDFLDRAVEGLRLAGVQEFLILGLLARAAYFRLTHDFANARADLDEAKEIAEFGDMKLYLVDYHLEYCCLNQDEQDLQDDRDLKDEAREHLRKAEKLIDETGYELRREEAEKIRKNEGKKVGRKEGKRVRKSGRKGV